MLLCLPCSNPASFLSLNIPSIFCFQGLCFLCPEASPSVLHGLFTSVKDLTIHLNVISSKMSSPIINKPAPYHLLSPFKIQAGINFTFFPVRAISSPSHVSVAAIKHQLSNGFLTKTWHLVHNRPLCSHVPQGQGFLDRLCARFHPLNSSMSFLPLSSRDGCLGYIPAGRSRAGKDLGSRIRGGKSLA